MRAVRRANHQAKASVASGTRAQRGDGAQQGERSEPCLQRKRKERKKRGKARERGRGRGRGRGEKRGERGEGKKRKGGERRDKRAPQARTLTAKRQQKEKRKNKGQRGEGGAQCARRRRAPQRGAAWRAAVGLHVGAQRWRRRVLYNTPNRYLSYTDYDLLYYNIPNLSQLYI